MYKIYLQQYFTPDKNIQTDKKPNIYSAGVTMLRHSINSLATSPS